MEVRVGLQDNMFVSHKKQYQKLDNRLINLIFTRW